MIALSNPEKIAFLTDSCADLSHALRKGKPIYIAPLRLSCADGEYSDGVDITAADVYRRLERGELPKTSLPTMDSVISALEQIKKDGYRKVIAIHLSSGLSGTYNMVRLMAEEWEGLEIAVFDSLSGSVGIGAAILQLWEDIKDGMVWEELTLRRTPMLLRGTHAFFSVDTLEYLARGGRIGKVTAMAGTMLAIKPILSFASDGQLTSVAKVRGRKQVQDKLVELIKASLGGHKRYNLAVANGGAGPEIKEFAAKLKAALPGSDHFWEADLDATLSVYIGSGVLGVVVQILE